MTESTYISDIAFTPEVKRQQTMRGSRKGYQRMVEQSDWQSSVTPDLTAFLAQTRSFYLATANSEGQPYIQHRGGPPGFLKVIDETHLGFADFAGNRQYISTGNLVENPKAHIFIMNYEQKQRVKLWGDMRVVEDDPALLESLRMPDYKARVERAYVFSLKAWDANCPQHIPQRVELADVQRVVGELQARIQGLEEENAELRAFLNKKDA